MSSDDTLVWSNGNDSEIESNFDTDTVEGAQDVDNTSSAPESDLYELPSNALDIIKDFQHYQTLPEVIHNLIMIGAVYRNSSSSTNNYICLSRSSPEDPMGLKSRSAHVLHGPMHA